MRPILIGHRGASSHHAENTMAAFAAASELGADAVELDVHASADGELVVHHDYLLDRTTSGSGLVHQRPWSYVRDLDAGTWFSELDAGARVPRLSDVLALPTLEFEVELKGLTMHFMRDVVSAVREADALERTEFTSWNVPMLLRLKEEHPGARIGLFNRRRDSWMPDGFFEEYLSGVAACGPFDVVHVHAGDITPDAVAAIHARGMVAHANDAATAADVQQALAAGADRISSDDVGLLVDLAARFPTDIGRSGSPGGGDAG